MNQLRKIKNLLETNQFLSAIFDKLAGSFLYRKFIYKKIEKYTKNIKKNKKYNIIIETSNACNAKCIMCPHIKMERKQEIMSQEIFNKIIEDLKKDAINPAVFILNGFGDPLTDKDIFERIKSLKKEFPDSAVKFYSNFGLADKNSINSILDSKLDEINISFNGFNKENYEEVMKINYNKTLENLENLIEEKNKRKSPLKIRISMTLVSANEGDEKKFIKKWEKKVDSVSINKIHNYNNSVGEVSGKNKINFKKTTYPCKYIWNTIVFSVKGDIVLCCLDYEGKYNFGNIAEKSVLDVFYSENFENFRKKHLNNEIKQIGMCATCYTPYKNGVEWLVDELY